MSYQPVVPLTGYVGWRFLERTMEAQQTAFQESAPVARATDYFRENIGQIETAEDLVKDRQLLSVALGAFGLDEDIDSKFFIEKILSEGAIDDDALANKLSDSRYKNLAEAFGFGDFAVPLSSQPAFAEDIIERYQDRQFERAVGESDNDLRLALNLDVGLDDVISSVETQDARWFALLGNEPLREVMQTALGLPTEVASIDIDDQLDIFKDRAASVFGTTDVADFADADLQEQLIRTFLVRSEAANISSFSSASVALTLLQA